jgi:protease I
MKPRVVFIIAQEGFRDEEFLEPKKILEKRGAYISVAATQRSDAYGKLGAIVKPDMTIEEVTVATYDAVVFVGGPGAREYFEDDRALKLVQSFHKSGKTIAGICSAVSILANAGVLIGKVATGFPSEESNIRDKGAEYTGMPVEVDGRIITAKDPTAAVAFGEAIADALGV